MNTILEQPIPHAVLHANPQFYCLGVKAKNASLLEPAGIEPLVRARRSVSPHGGHGLHRQFLACGRPKNRLFRPDPHSSSQRVAGRPCGTTPTANAAPCLSDLRSEARVPSLSFATLTPASALRSAITPPDTPPGVRLSPRGGVMASLTRWQSASATPTRAGAGFSWTSPAPFKSGCAGAACGCLARFNRSSQSWKSASHPEISLGPQGYLQADMPVINA
jgi:hypothetical protein